MSDTKRYTNKGQVLVMILMIVALTATLAGTTVFRMVNDTRNTKDTEEKQKTQNVAQGIIEKFLNDETVNVGNDFTTGSLNTGVAPVITQGFAPSEFVTRVIPKDSQHFFYTWQYDYGSKQFVAPSPPGPPINIDIFFRSEATECPVLEIIHIDGVLDDTITKRQVTNACDANVITGSANILTANTIAAQSMTFQDESGTFTKRVTVNGVTASTKMLVVRPVFGATRFGFRMNPAGTNLPPQGEFIVATARSAGGAQSDERVYRPYPQIPDFFFTTSF